MMTREQFEKACYATRVLVERPFATAIASQRNLDAPDSAPHLSWMLSQAITFSREGKEQKAHRWLGFVQGALLCMYGASLDEIKRANMPAGEAFDREKV